MIFHEIALDNLRLLDYLSIVGWMTQKVGT